MPRHEESWKQDDDDEIVTFEDLPMYPEREVEDGSELLWIAVFVIAIALFMLFHDQTL